MAKSSKGKAIGGALVGRAAPGMPNKGVPSPASGTKVSSKPTKSKVKPWGKSTTLANGTRKGVMNLPSGGV